MTIALRQLNTLDPELVQATLDETVQRIAEDNPQLDLRRGVLAELLVYYHAVLETQTRQNLTDYLNARSLAAIQNDPTLADPELVDDVLSNFGITRKEGRKAVGTVVVVVSANTSIIVGAQTVWEARGRRYVTPTVYTAKAEQGQVTADTDRLLAAIPGTSNYAFTITVEAEETGTEFDVKKDTLVVPLAVPANYVTSYAAEDFSAGLSVETTEALLQRLQEGIAAKAMSNRVNMSASLREIDVFSRIVAMSIVGNGDAELLRAFHSLLPITLTGRCDWYVRTQEKTTTTRVRLTATLLEINLDYSGVWQIEIDKETGPALYEVVDIRPPDTDPSAGGYAILADVRSMDLTSDLFVPDIVTAVEAAYTAYSTAIVQFTDTRSHADLAVGATREYDVGLVLLPLIAEIQAHVSSRDVRPYGGDCLVKAPVPCFFSCQFTIYKRTGQADPDLAAIRAALCSVVNTVGFVGAIYASQLHDVIHNYLSDGQTVSAIDMRGRLRKPDGTVDYYHDSECLRFTSSDDDMVTTRTVQFFADDTTILIGVVTAVPSNL